MKIAPVGDHLVDAARPKPGEVITHGIPAAAAIGPFAAVGQHGVVLPQDHRVLQVAGKALHERAVDAGIAHPLEMPQHGRVLERTEDLGRPPIGIFDLGGEAALRAQFGEIGPEIDADVSGGGHAGPVFRPVVPGAAGAVALAGEPALVAAQHLALQRGGVAAVLDGTAIGLERCELDRFQLRRLSFRREARQKREIKEWEC